MQWPRNEIFRWTQCLSRKKLKPNKLSEWELRINKFRIFIDDFNREIELTRQNEKLMKFLEKRARQTETVSLAEAKKLLRPD